jgi:hypothetical protein
MPSRFSSFASLLSPADVIERLTIQTGDSGIVNSSRPPVPSPTRCSNNQNEALILGSCAHYLGQLCDLSLVSIGANASAQQSAPNLSL